MDAVEYLKDKARMTSRIDSVVCTISCKECPLSASNNKVAIDCKSFESHYPEKAVEIIEKWSAEHPKKTRQSEFLKMFPNAKLDESGVLILCPLHIDKEYRSSMAQALYCFKPSCSECCKSYWLEEIE